MQGSGFCNLSKGTPLTNSGAGTSLFIQPRLAKIGLTQTQIALLAHREKGTEAVPGFQKHVLNAIFTEGTGLGCAARLYSGVGKTIPSAEEF